ncbi:MAG TPA: hypothetical protein VMM12_16215 [Longimicrobiales bacterium]|nr:hypothetical protein [Longimicrobiales bacterium]
MTERTPGFALPVALLLMLVGTVLALTALHVAGSDLEANRAMRLSHAALRAAEAGGHRTLIRWAGTGADDLTPGDSLDTGWVALPGRGTYRSVILRIDDGAGVRRFRVRTIGRPAGPARAQRVLYTIVEGGGTGGAARAAVTVQRRLLVRGGAGPSPQIDGTDRTPPGWGALCTAPGPDVPGVLISDLADLRLQSGGALGGNPPEAEDPAIGDVTFATPAGRSFADLAAGADVVFAGNTSIPTAVGPVSTGGTCDRSSPLNWGDPDPGGPCSDYLPVIHAMGNLNLGGGGVGQGILLVDGDLRVTGPLRFNGLVVVLGSVDIGSFTTIAGALMVRNGTGGTLQSTIAAPARVVYSACAVSRATAASAPRFLAGRHWFDVG